MRKVKTSWDSQQRNRKVGTASLGSRRAIADLFVLFISKLPIVLIWNIQSLQGNRPVTPLKCTKSAHRGTGMIYDSCRFDIGRFRVEPTDLWKVSTSIGQICIYRSAHNNLFLTLRVIHKLTGTSSGLSILLKKDNMAWSFVGKLEQVSTYILWKFKTINVGK